MSVLTLEQIKVIPPVVAHSIPVPEMGNGTTAWIAELTAQERETRIEGPWRAMKEATGREGGLRAYLVAACLCTDGSRTFMVPDGSVPGLADELSNFPLKVFDRLFNACEEINGLSDQEALEKN